LSISLIKMSDDASSAPAKRGRKPAAEKAEKTEKPETKKRTKKVTVFFWVLQL